MSSVIQFPNERIVYPGVDNPLFISDIQVANQGILDGLNMITGLSLTAFAILSGLTYVPGSPNTYTPGFIFLNGQFYYVSASFNEGLYLTANVQQILPEAFNEVGVSHPIYKQYGSVTSPTGGAGYTPVFTGNMNQYRISLSYTQSQVNILNGVIAALGNSSTRNVGTTAGTVAAGDDSRFGYSTSQIDTLISNRIPAYKGALYFHYDTDNNYADNFNGSGIGIVFPWIGWALCDGQSGRADFTGKAPVGVGTGFAPKSTGGIAEITLTDDNIPPLVTDPVFTNTGGGGTPGYTKTNTASTLGSVPVNAGSPTDPINIQNPYIAVYVAIKIV